MTRNLLPAAATLIFMSLLACSTRALGPAAPGGSSGAGEAGVLGAAGSSGGHSPGPDGQLTGGTAGGTAGQSDECRGSLDEVGGPCPATFDGAIESLPACTHVNEQEFWACDGVVALSLQGPGAYSTDCYYDTSSHTLVGALFDADGNFLCGNSFTMVAGEAPPVACRYPPFAPTFYRSCFGNDAGVDSSDSTESHD